MASRDSLSITAALGPPWRLSLVVIGAWIVWAAVASAKAGSILSATSPYVVAPVAVASGVHLGRQIQRRVPLRAISYAVLALAMVSLLSVLVTAGPAKGPLGYANANAAAAVQLMVLCGLTIVRGEPGRMPWVAMTIAFGTVIANRSAAAWGVALVVVVVVIWALLRPPRRRWPSPVAAAIVSVAASAIVVQLASRLRWPSALLAALDPARQTLWQDALSSWKAHPVAGVGPGRFQEISRLGADPDTAAAHSAVLQIGAETGWIGVGLFAALVGLALFWGSRARPTDAMIASAGIAALVIHAQADHLLEFAPVVFAAGVVIGWAGKGAADEVESEELDVPEGQGPLG